MGVEGDLEHVPYGYIPGFVQSIYIIGEQIPKIAAIKAKAVDVHKPHKDLRLHKVKLLKQRVDFTNEFSSFNGYIPLHSVVTLEHIAKVLDLLYPGKRIMVKVTTNLEVYVCDIMYVMSCMQCNKCDVMYIMDCI